MFINPVIGKINNLYSYNVKESKPKPQLQAKGHQISSSVSFGRMLPELSGEEIKQINDFGQACVKKLKESISGLETKIPGKRNRERYIELKDVDVLNRKADILFNAKRKLVLSGFRGYYIRTKNEMILFNLVPTSYRVLKPTLQCYAKLSTENEKTTMQRFVLKDDGKSIDHVEEYSGKSIEFDAFTHFLTGNKHKHKF